LTTRVLVFGVHRIVDQDVGTSSEVFELRISGASVFGIGCVHQRLFASLNSIGEISPGVIRFDGGNEAVPDSNAVARPKWLVFDLGFENHFGRHGEKGPLHVLKNDVLDVAPITRWPANDKSALWVEDGPKKWQALQVIVVVVRQENMARNGPR
jgi:hypothetical protein